MKKKVMVKFNNKKECKECGKLVDKCEMEFEICFSCWNHEIDFSGGKNENI